MAQSSLTHDLQSRLPTKIVLRITEYYFRVIVNTFPIQFTDTNGTRFFFIELSARKVFREIRKYPEVFPGMSRELLKLLGLSVNRAIQDKLEAKRRFWTSYSLSDGDSWFALRRESQFLRRIYSLLLESSSTSKAQE